MAMYHSWDSQNAWLRQIHSHNYLYVNPRDRARGRHRRRRLDAGSSRRGASVRCMARYSEAVEPGTVWTWNAIGKAAAPGSSRPTPTKRSKGFLLNHLITDELPDGGAAPISNSDPITGPGRLVRRARAHLPGRRRRAAGDVAAASRRCRRCPDDRRAERA